MQQCPVRPVPGGPGVGAHAANACVGLACGALSQSELGPCASRLCTDFATHLQTKSIGLGDARCLVIAHPEAELGGEDPTLSDEAAATADALYRDLKAAGDSISRDEVRTRVALGELTGATPSLLCADA